MEFNATSSDVGFRYFHGMVERLLDIQQQIGNPTAETVVLDNRYVIQTTPKIFIISVSRVTVRLNNFAADNCVKYVNLNQRSAIKFSRRIEYPVMDVYRSNFFFIYIIIQCYD